jgi:F0F1-type ATP synthase membrane subunit c/vacuolar-type H+-ATPase subunit K
MGNRLSYLGHAGHWPREFAVFLIWSPNLESMGRNLYILAASLTVFAAISCGVAFTNIAQQPGSPGDASLWRTMGLVLFLIALVVALAGILSSLFAQAERRAEDQRDQRRRRRS